MNVTLKSYAFLCLEFSVALRLTLGRPFSLLAVKSYSTPFSDTVCSRFFLLSSPPLSLSCSFPRHTLMHQIKNLFLHLRFIFMTITSVKYILFVLFLINGLWGMKKVNKDKKTKNTKFHSWRQFIKFIIIASNQLERRRRKKKLIMILMFFSFISHSLFRRMSHFVTPFVIILLFFSLVFFVCFSLESYIPMV